MSGSFGQRTSFTDGTVAADTAAGAPAQPRILLVEDDPSLREAIGLILADAGYTVVSASRAAEVAGMLERFAIDLVISDHRLTDGTSSDVMRAIRQISSSIPALVMSGHFDSDQKETAYAQGFAACLLKPVDADHLEQAARRALRDKR